MTFLLIMPGGPSQEYMTTVPEAIALSLRDKGYTVVDCHGKPTMQPSSHIGLVRENELVGVLAYQIDGLSIAWKLFAPSKDTKTADDVTCALSEQSQHLRKVVNVNPSELVQTP